MNLRPLINQSPLCLAAAGLVGLAANSMGATSLNAVIDTRPLTPQNITTYALPAGTQVASGLATVPIGQPVYLDALVNLAMPASDIVSITWELTSQPLGSLATLATSPLGANVPTYQPAEQLVSQVAGRTMLVPDLVGQYSVVATITTANGTATVTKEITAATYMGLNTCAMCHSGGVVAPNKVVPWEQTGHAKIFTEGINGLASDHYGKNCLGCHTVGYNANTNAVNGGFDDMAKKMDWTFPAVLASTNWAALPEELKNLGNIQCENCHGPGSQHAYSLGNPDRISVSFNSGDCAQCHDSGTHHYRPSEWNNSRHAIATEHPSGAGRESCVGCHTGIGFADRMKGKATTNTAYEPITCAACHEPHDVSNPHQLRNVGPVTLKDGTVVTTGGNGALCMNCHMARVNAATYVETTAGSSRFGPHHGPQADMLMGVNAVTYGKDIPSSAHREVVEEACVTCHMQTVESPNPAFRNAGGHTFKVKWENATNTVELTEACVGCHGEVTTFNFARQDFDGNGIVEGVQDEVKGLLNKLALQLPPVGVPKTSLTITTNWTRPQLRAAYNYQFVLEDGSFGIHNLAYAVGLLKASIADLTGDANNDGLADAWQIQYFGSANNPDAAPNANPTGDGVPNWLKFSLGLDPTKPGITMPGGVVWASGKDLVNPPIDPSATNTLAIYTAAEITFNTEAGKNYQLQSIASMADGWQNVGNPIAGTGAPVSYVTPTRANVQQFYRVVTSQ